MWIAVFDFCLLLLLGAFFLYGLNQWELVLADVEESTSDQQAEDYLPQSGRFLALWALIAGVAIATMLQDIIAFIS